MRRFMKEFKEAINMEDRDMLMNGKFHQLSHYVRYIELFGAPDQFQ